MSGVHNNRLTNWHVLAQQRSSSQDSSKTSDSDSNSNTGSDSNLARRRNPDIRKSTLMKRFWESSKSNLNTGLPSFPSSYAEWQHGGYKSRHGSTKSLFNESPKRAGQSQFTNLTKSPKSPRSPRRHLHLQSLTHVYPQSETQTPDFANLGYVTPRSEDDYVVYSSTEHTARTGTSTRTGTELSDSYPVSTSSTVNNNSSSSAMAMAMAHAQNNPQQIGITKTQQAQQTKAYRINDNGISDVTNDPVPNLPIKYQFVINDPENTKMSQNLPNLPRESGKTNLNVITNVQLSQSTLNTIFSQVMHDVLHTPPLDPELLDDNITKQTAFNFKMNMDEFPTVATPNTNNNLENLKVKSENNDKTEQNEGFYKGEEVRSEQNGGDDCNDSGRKRISEVNVGSPYKSATPSVPRLSALPRTTSMEVNISSNDSIDNNSDTSLVDSLDDPSSPRLKVKHQTNINITKQKEKTRVVKNNDSNLQNDASNDDEDTEIIEEEFTKKIIQKSSVFYIPIDDSTQDTDTHTVSDLLPNKLKERLMNRQIKREEKRIQERMKAFEKDLENGNLSYASTSPDFVSSTAKKAKSNKRNRGNTKTTLPQLSQVDLSKDYNKSLRSNYTQRSLNRYRESTTSTAHNKKVMLPKTGKPNLNAKTKSKNSSSSTRKTNANSKHIEILEIMEIVEPERVSQLTPKTKSRIPVFQHSSTTTKLPKLKPKPTFLDFGEVGQPGDPKLDQLIANILIDTLNHEDIKDKDTNKEKIKAEKVKHTIQGYVASGETSNVNNNASLLEQAAEILTKQVLDNNNLDLMNNISGGDGDSPKLVENVDGRQDVELNDIPKGWITFYMLQKAQSPDSNTSDEENAGKARNEEKTRKTATKSTQYTTRDAGTVLLSRGSTQNVKQRKIGKILDKQDGWSVTFSNGNNQSNLAPEVEMKFKFPSLSSKQQSKRSQSKDEAVSKSPGLNYDDVCLDTHKSEIYKSRQYLKQPTNIKIRRRQIILSPRPTKTSRQRKLLHRQHHVHNPEDESDISYLLSVSGNQMQSLNQLQRLPRLSELLLKNLISKLHQQRLSESEQELISGSGKTCKESIS